MLQDKFMASPFLYSVNPLLKYEIQRDYFGHSHFVWCADCFDARRLNSLHPVQPLAASSNPAEIYARVRAATDINRPDFHDPNILAWRQGIKERAVSSRLSGGITSEQEADIVYLADHATIQSWRPVLYVINRAAVAAKLSEVPAAERANPGAMEYRIAELFPAEFDMIEVP